MTAGGNDLPKENEPADPIAAAISRVKKLRALELELEAELGSDILALARDPAMRSVSGTLLPPFGTISVLSAARSEGKQHGPGPVAGVVRWLFHVSGGPASLSDEHAMVTDCRNEVRSVQA